MLRLLRATLSVIAVVLATNWCMGQDANCSSYNFSATPFVWSTSGAQEHASGDHLAVATITGACTYANQSGSTACTITCSGAVQGASINEPPNDGTLTTLIDSHYGNYSTAPGQASSNGPQIQCTGVVAAEVQSCATAITCNVAISINATADGVGSTATYASGSLWTSAVGTQPITCGAKNHCAAVPSAPTGLSASGTTSGATTLSWNATAPPTDCTISSYNVLKTGSSIGSTTSTSFAVTGLSPSTTYTFTVEASDSAGTSGPSAAVTVTTQSEPGGSSGDGCCGGSVICSGDGIRSGAGNLYVCDPSTCDCEFASPIIIDTTGRGFHLTSLQNGVKFDILNSGIPIKIAWTAAGSGNAFLALDRNHNGRIDNGSELFGNHTQQPSSENPNGFLALEEFDKPENGGNGDGIIDSRDAVYSKLLLWIDENHDGISQPSELHTLSELGVYSISLKYREEPMTDQYGNWFHYRSAVNPDPLDGESKDGRLTYDVFFIGPRTAPKKSLDKIISEGDRSLR